MARKKSDKKIEKKRKGVKKEIVKYIPKSQDEKETEKPVSKEEQIKSNNKILRNILIVIGVIALGVISFVIVSNSLSRFEYRGVNFEIVRFCDAGPPCLVTYRTSIPIDVEGTTVPFNFYLRNDPRELEERVDFTGDIFFSRDMVLNSEADFVCDGKGAIAAANLIQLYSVMGTKVIKDENASCDLLGRYLFVQVKPGNKTKVDQFGPRCYNIDIKGCEILEGTEKFMIETLVKVNEDLKK